MLCSVFVGCNHKELCYHHPHTSRIRVAYDWSNAPEADPEGMCVYFYPEDGRAPIRVDFSGTDGGYVDLDNGRYTAITYNNDTEAVQFGGIDKFATHFAYTRTGGLFESVAGMAGYDVPRADDNERVVICPEMLWGARASQIIITDAGMQYVCPSAGRVTERSFDVGDDYVIIFTPEELVCHYSYEIRNVSNLGSVSRMSASLSGMSSGMLLGDFSLDRECVTLPFDATADDTGTTIYGQFLTFGYSEENVQQHRLLLYVWLEDGRKLCYGRETERFDVTAQIHTAPDRRRVHIIIDGLDLPEPITSGGGFDVNVDDWIQINEDLYF